jgi:hypothetical protein
MFKNTFTVLISLFLAQEERTGTTTVSRLKLVVDHRYSHAPLKKAIKKLILV